MEKQPSMDEFAKTPGYKSIRTYLDINELLAIGVRKKVFDEGICYGFWHGVLDRVATRARPVIDHARRPPHENSYENLLALHARWKVSLLKSQNSQRGLAFSAGVVFGAMRFVPRTPPHPFPFIG
jgi:hypothetical protein